MNCLTLFLFCYLYASSALDYSGSADWSDSTCSPSVKDHLQSPIDATSSGCVAYESFSLDLPTTALTFAMDQNKGTLAAPYTSGTLEVNSRSFTSTEILIRHTSEHIISGTPADLEIQIFFTDASDSTLRAALAFLVRQKGTNKAFQNAGRNPVLIIGTTINDFDLKLGQITSTINEKLSQGLFLNLLHYEGTTTYPDPTTSACNPLTWYIYGSEFFVDDSTVSNFVAILQAQAGATILRNSENNNRPVEGTNAGSGKHSVQRLCFTGYFKNTMGDNYGLWFGLTIITIWFIMNLILGEKPIISENYIENTWTHHPLVSIHTYSNELFTRKQRSGLLLVTLSVQALFSSVFYRQSDNRTRSSNIIVFAIYSTLIDIVVTHIVGVILRGYVIAKSQFYKTKEEAWEQRAQNKIFIFYLVVFAIFAISWSFTVWNMGELHPEKDLEASNYWVASFFIGIGLELIIVDPIACLLAKKIGFVRAWITQKGYFYDHITHEAYLASLKHD